MQPNFSNFPLHKRFHPIPEGCVVHDARLARATEELYAEELAAVASASYRSMLCESCAPSLAGFFHEQTYDEIAHFRFLGELILALGGNPAIRSQVRVEPMRVATDGGADPGIMACAVARAALGDKRRSVDRYQTLLGRCEDRVVRSLLLALIDDEQRHAEYLRHFLETDKN